MSHFKNDQIVVTTLPGDETSLPHSHYGIIPGLKARITRSRGDIVWFKWVDGPLAGGIEGPWHESWFADHGDKRVPADQVTIDFGLDRYATAREYAARARSRVLPSDANEVFDAAAAGEKVNVLALNAALPKAFSAAATRYGQSPARRQATKELRHLSHIATSTIANIVNGLPPVESGQRSPRIAELEAEVAALKAQAKADCPCEDSVAVGAAIAEAKDEVDKQVRLREEAEANVKRLKGLINNLEADFEAVTIKNDDLVKEARENQAVLDYALGLLDFYKQVQVNGFRVGYGTRASEEI